MTGIVFFVIDHDLFVSVPEYQRNAFAHAAQIGEGSFKRRIAVSLFGAIGLVDLMIQRGHPLVVRGALARCVIFFFAWSFASLLWSADRVFTIRRLLVFASIAVCAAAFSRRMSWTSLILLTWFLTATYLVVGVAAELFLGTFDPLADGYRFYGTSRPNGEGLNCCLLLISAVAAYMGTGRALFLTGVPLAVTFLILSGSRTALVCAGIGIALLWFWSSSPRRRLIGVLCSFSALCCVWVMFEDRWLPAARHAVLLGRDNETATLTGRVPIWTECLKEVDKNPLLGVGYHSFWGPENLKSAYVTQGWGTPNAHSAYVELLLDLGAVGLLAYVLTVGLAIWQSRRQYVRTRQPGHLFAAVVLVVIATVGLLESVLVFYPSFIAFISLFCLFRLGFEE